MLESMKNAQINNGIGDFRITEATNPLDPDVRERGTIIYMPSFLRHKAEKVTRIETTNHAKTSKLDTVPSRFASPGQTTAQAVDTTTETDCSLTHEFNVCPAITETVALALRGIICTLDPVLPVLQV